MEAACPHAAGSWTPPGEDTRPSASWIEGCVPSRGAIMDNRCPGGLC